MDLHCGCLNHIISHVEPRLPAKICYLLINSFFLLRFWVLLLGPLPLLFFTFHNNIASIQIAVHRMRSSPAASVVIGGRRCCQLCQSTCGCAEFILEFVVPIMFSVFACIAFASFRAWHFGLNQFQFIQFCIIPLTS